MKSGDFSSLSVLVASILWIFDSRATSILAADLPIGIAAKSNDSVTDTDRDMDKDTDRIHSVGRDLAAMEENFNSTENSPDVLTCLLERWSDANVEGGRDGCYQHFWSSWESIGNAGEDRDGIVQGNFVRL